MAVWEVFEDAVLSELITSLPANLFQQERWFADRELDNHIMMVDSVLFRKPTIVSSVIALNLYKIKPCAEYHYYIPFLISQSPNPEREAIFLKNGFYFYDAVPTYEYVSLLEQLFENQISFSASHGSFIFQHYRDQKEPNLRLIGGTSNSLLFVIRNYLLKSYRRIYPGTNPELKISAALTKLGSNQIPEVYGSFKYQVQMEYTLGIIMEAVDNMGTGWERWGQLLKGSSGEAEEILLEDALLLGKALGFLHRDLATIAREAGDYSELNWADLDKRINRLIVDIRDDLTGILELAPIISKLNSLKKQLSEENLGAKFRIHGDLHLEQVIKTTNGWRILDFEGEPLKPITERENCDSPLKDLASMLRSISYRINGGETAERNCPEIEEQIKSRLVEGYLGSFREVKVDFLPDNDRFGHLLTLLQIERAVYECLYESKYRPDWLWIPRTGLEKLVYCN